MILCNLFYNIRRRF